MRLNLFELAGLQLQKEHKDPNKNLSELINRAIKIRQWLDKHKEQTAIKIMRGQKLYRYKNILKCYDRFNYKGKLKTIRPHTDKRYLLEE